MSFFSQSGHQYWPAESLKRFRPVTSLPQLMQSLRDAASASGDGLAGGTFSKEWTDGSSSEVIDVKNERGDSPTLLEARDAGADDPADTAPQVHGDNSIASASSLKIIPPHVGQVTS